MAGGRIRAIVIGILWREDRLLVAESVDTVKRRTFYRPLGGSIEFGERGEEALRREFREEIGATLASVRYLATLENLFTHEGAPGHEIVLVYAAEFADRALYERDSFDGAEDGGVPFTAFWKRLDEFTAHTPLYPDGLPKLLKGLTPGSR